ncbi:MAG: hypothetical protein EZS28_005165 [Streblomastix strix]|uniref:Uncharacterized protein n=1 Tax=Streblomastix strix TaxID=222440 RepID=A0A5J4WWJ5_9EUKA|nr:MAG: hypothetical protein EZS28_005165 [Streblomastix strix]
MSELFVTNHKAVKSTTLNKGRKQTAQQVWDANEKKVVEPTTKRTRYDSPETAKKYNVVPPPVPSESQDQQPKVIRLPEQLEHLGPAQRPEKRVTFTQKEKTKRDRGMQNSDKDFVQEEKRIMRQEAKSEYGF